MWFAKIFWKNTVKETYLPNSSIVAQIVSDISPVMLLLLHTNPSKFDLGLNVKTQVKFRRIFMESSEHNCAYISETICSEIFGK